MEGESTSQAAEPTGAEAPVTETTQQSSESPAPLSQAESLRAHMESQKPSESSEAESTEATETDNQDSKDIKPASKEVEKKEVEIDSDTQTFLDENKIDIGDLASNETAMNLVNQLRDAKAENTKIVNQQNMTNVALEKKRADKAADSIIESESGAVEPPLSPVKQAEVDFNNDLQNMMKMSGYDNIDQLAEDNPELAQKIVNDWNQKKEDAFLKENDWYREQDKKANDLEADKKKVDDEYTAVKATANDRLAEAKKTYPKLSEEMKDSGIDEMLDELSEITNIPHEYFVANEKFFDVFAKAAHAITVAKDMPNIQKKIKGKLEQEIFNTKTNESVASDDPLPADHKKVLTRAGGFGKGVSF